MRKLIIVIFCASLVSCASNPTTPTSDTAKKTDQQSKALYFSQLHTQRR